MTRPKMFRTTRTASGRTSLGRPAFIVHPVDQEAVVDPAVLGDEGTARQRQRMLVTEVEVAPLQEGADPERHEQADIVG